MICKNCKSPKVEKRTILEDEEEFEVYYCQECGGWGAWQYDGGNYDDK